MVPGRTGLGIAGGTMAEAWRPLTVRRAEVAARVTTIRPPTVAASQR
jgi:hypothetical protein